MKRKKKAPTFTPAYGAKADAPGESCGGCEPAGRTIGNSGFDSHAPLPRRLTRLRRAVKRVRSDWLHVGGWASLN